jgi:hypothetical protein
LPALRRALCTVRDVSAGGVEAIAEAAKQIKIKPDQVWCAGGSGTLAKAMRRAWPNAEHHVVQVGHALSSADVAGAIVHVHPKPYRHALPASASPFPSDPHYDAKAWQVCQVKRARNGCILFWNVMGPAEQLW